MAITDVRLFGAVRVTSAPDECDLSLSPSVQLLLSYLVLHRGASHPRERLVESLWQDVAPGVGRSRLNTTVWRLRQQLNRATGTELVRSSSAGELRLDERADLWLDVAEFEQTATRLLRVPVVEVPDAVVAQTEQGLALCTQELMEGHYRGWVLDERKRLTGLKERCLTRLMEIYAVRGRDEEAIARALDLLALDPLREDAHRAVMAAQLRMGRPHLARRQYELCRELLAGELGVEPVAETRAMSERLAHVEAGGELSRTQLGEILALREAVSVAEDQLRDISRRIGALLGDNGGHGPSRTGSSRPAVMPE